VPSATRIAALVGAVCVLSLAGLDTAGMDPSVAPGDDFFRYANGGWMKTTQIPADRASWGASSILAEEARVRTRELLEQAAQSGSAEGTPARKAGDYFASYLDEAAIESKGIAPLKPAFDEIAAISDRRSLAQVLGRGLRADVDPLNATNFYTSRILGLWVAPSLSDPARYAPYLLQGGLGMPDREYYLANAPRMADIRTKYQAHIAAMLKLAGIDGAEAKAARIFDLELRIARAHASRSESENVLKANNPWKREEFPARAPGMDWAAYFEAAALSRQPVFIVWQPGAVTGIAALVGGQPLDVWKEYLTFHAIERHAGVLPKAFVEERFAFFGKVLTGTPQLADRWKRAVDSTNAALGDAVGQLYVARYFPPEAKAKAQEMVRDLVAAFGRRIDNLGWMTPATKAKAKEKLTTLKVGVGYPDKWVDYSTLQIVRGDALGNAQRAGLFEYRRNLAKFGRLVDHTEWVMTPQTVNAVNLPIDNALNFPAAILQPPYFDPKASRAANYGSIGAVIGHEISHSFDDQGSQFDAVGRLTNWWTDADLSHFKTASAALAAQYDAYKPFPDAHVNGELTLSENIADLGGLAVAYDAYRGQGAAGKAPGPDDKAFFLAFAQSWRQKLREPALRQQLMTDSHSPAEYRADIIRNMDAWYSAFPVKPGQALYLAPDKRVRIW
jgi:putative endopeptidase